MSMTSYLSAMRRRMQKGVYKAFHAWMTIFRGGSGTGRY
ncbi:hypothetical protein ASZ90_010619 [hydrocarbon metagenome]|uniref:Uncharacterized protein n=1 Tax=hydrocarbon metagenome TaxID=938273 RepID=A0A0W8FFS8_9ZZZZ